MRFTDVILSVLGLATAAQAFTNGTLLPGYLCGVQGDGFPKSAGTLIPYLQLGTALDNFNIFPPGNNTNPKFQIVLGGNATQAQPPTARQLVGAFHNGGTAAGTTFEQAFKNPIWIAPFLNTAADILGTNPHVITPGKLHSFIVGTNCPNTAADMAGFNNANSALDGFFLYARDTVTGQRIGSWVNVGTTMINWPSCTLNGQFGQSVGIVHNQLASCCANLANLTWQAPAAIQGLVEFVGAGVADCGFGPVSVIYNTTTTQTAPTMLLQGFIPTVNAGAVALTDPAAAPLPQGQGTGQAAAATGTVSTLAAGGIAVGAAIAGGIVVGIIVFAVAKKSSTSGNNALLL